MLDLANKFGRFDRKTHKIDEYPISPGGEAPVVIRAEVVDKNGDAHIYAACSLASSVADINLRTKKITVHKEPAGPVAAEQAAKDYQDNVWIAHIPGALLGVLNPRTGNITEIVIPGSVASAPNGLALYGGTGYVTTSGLKF